MAASASAARAGGSRSVEGAWGGLHFLPETGTFEIVDTADAADRITVHNERNFTLATALARLPHPMALGVLYCDPAEDFTTAWEHRTPYRPMNRDDLQTLMTGENTWVVG